MKYSFHPLAEKEFQEAVEYYNKLRTGLGIQFAEEVYSVIQRIIAFPELWTPLSSKLRRCLVTRFPYGIIYHTTDEEIFILAVMQLNRKPGYWKKRVI